MLKQIILILIRIQVENGGSSETFIMLGTGVYSSKIENNFFDWNIGQYEYAIRSISDANITIEISNNIFYEC